MKKKVKFNWFNFIVLIAAIASGLLLFHDFTIWGVIPLFTGKTVMMTYTGMLTDVMAICILDLTVDYIAEWK